MKRLLIAGGVIALLLAAVVSYYASSQPDGLNKVAEDHGIATQEQDSATAGSPLADYAVSGMGNERLSTAAAGVVGVAVTAAVGFGVFQLLRVRRN
ncbi:MAG TPA: PDGLE domain-containing protein [Actinomycetota bacterium]|nr:PDGLE domain-containing protein [Actinomycetota bacterium]